MPRHLLAGLLALCLLVLNGCLAPTVQTPSPAPLTTPETSAATTAITGTATSSPAGSQAGSERQLTDALGREVTLPASPQAIVSLAPSATEILFAIGAGPQVIGRTEFDNYPSAVAALPSVGGFSAKSISIETLLSLEPDLVIAGSRSQVEIADTLAQAGIPVYVLAPQSLADIQVGILTLGEITGNVGSAQALVADMQARIAAVSAKIATLSPEQQVTLFYEVWHDPLTTTSQATYIGELLSLAGGINIFADLPDSYPNISAEQIIALDPQVIIGPSNRADQLTVEMLSARPGWQDLSAIQSGRIHLVDGDVISRPGPRVVDALETIAAALYPDLFTK